MAKMSKVQQELLNEREKRIRAQAKLQAMNRYMDKLERILEGKGA